MPGREKREGKRGKKGEKKGTKPGISLSRAIRTEFGPAKGRETSSGLLFFLFGSGFGLPGLLSSPLCPFPPSSYCTMDGRVAYKLAPHPSKVPRLLTRRLCKAQFPLFMMCHPRDPPGCHWGLEKSVKKTRFLSLQAEAQELDCGPRAYTLPSRSIYFQSRGPN